MSLSGLNSSINLSKRGVGFPYYQEQLKAFWIEVKRLDIYEYDTIPVLQNSNEINKKSKT
jgi:hypothetical protein